jgi:hypothetical protein
MLFITLGDGPIDPSPTPVNQPSDPAEPTPRAHSLPTEWIGSASQPRVGWRPRSPACPRQRRSAPCAKNEPTRPDRAATPRTHMTQPFFVVDQSFYYIVSHFTIMNSVILLEWTQPFFYSAQSFFDCCSAQSFHMIKFSTIPPCYSAKIFIIL